jgi:hypothetical protein
LSPLTAPLTTTWPTWTPSGPYSFAIARAKIRRPALAELNAPHPATAQRVAGAGEQDGAPVPRDHAARRLPPEQKPAEADPPALAEVVRLHLEDATGRVVARVVDREIHLGAGMLEERGDAASLVASAANDDASPPDLSMSATTASSEADVRLAATTCNPSLAKRLQSCAPSPRSGRRR